MRIPLAWMPLLLLVLLAGAASAEGVDHDRFAAALERLEAEIARVEKQIEDRSAMLETVEDTDMRAGLSAEIANLLALRTKMQAAREATRQAWMERTREAARADAKARALRMQGPERALVSDRPFAAGDGDRIDHLRAAARHLHEAGKHRQAKELEREIRAWERRRERRRSSAPDVHASVEALTEEVRDLRRQVKEIKALLLERKRRTASEGDER